MSTRLTAPPRGRSARLGRSRSPCGARGGEPTLDAHVSGAWERLAARGEATCPVCAGRLGAVYAVAATPVEGRCADCGATLS